MAVAVEAVVRGAVLLEPVLGAGGAFATRVQPVAVRVETILDMVLIDRNIVFCGEFTGFIPGGDFKLQEFKVTFVGGVAKQTVA